MKQFCFAERAQDRLPDDRSQRAFENGVIAQLLIDAVERARRGRVPTHRDARRNEKRRHRLRVGRIWRRHTSTSRFISRRLRVALRPRSASRSRAEASPFWAFWAGELEVPLLAFLRGAASAPGKRFWDGAALSILTAFGFCCDLRAIAAAARAAPFAQRLRDPIVIVGDFMRVGIGRCARASRRASSPKTPRESRRFRVTTTPIRSNRPRAPYPSTIFSICASSESGVRCGIERVEASSASASSKIAASRERGLGPG